MAETNNVIDIGALVKSFDPNEGAPEGGAMLPSVDAGGPEVGAGIDAYVGLASRVLGGTAPSGTILDRVMQDFQKAVNSSWDALEKAIKVPANFLTFARMSYMPDPTGSEVLPWPGIHPEALRKIVLENLAPNLIIGMRCDDVLQYSQPSEHLWKPGWRLELLEGDKSPTREDKKDILEAKRFLANSSGQFTYSQALQRDKANLTDFQHFLVAIVADSLTFDGMAISTDRDSSGRVVRYGAVPAGNIRLTGSKGYNGDANIFAVSVDEGSAVVDKFTREQLIWYVRNPRTDPLQSITMTRGYGTPEIQIALRLIQVFQNTIEYNADIFNRSGVPHGLLLLTGNGWTQKQVDVLTRMWHNLKRGISKALALPVLAAPRDGKVEVVDFSRIKGDEALYQDLLNLSIGCFCAVYRFPAHRLGYRISGRGPDSKRDSLESPGRLIDDDDPGRVALLVHLEGLLNQNMIWPRWPNLRFQFTGKEPKADAREYEARKNAQTWAEARAEADLPKLSTLVSKDLKELAEVMEMAPVDPNLSGVFQSVVAAYVKGEAREGDDLSFGQTMNSTKDPARAEHHGKVSGVRRDSASEGTSSTH